MGVVGALATLSTSVLADTLIAGKTFFVYADTWYRAFASDGDTLYQVVEDPRPS